MFSNCTLYFSHPIRGSNNDFKGNCKKTIAAVKRLRNVFPEVDFYCPAEHEFIFKMITDKKLTTLDKLIHLIDLEILRNCHGWFWYKFDESRGSTIEQNRAIELGFCSEHNCIFTFDLEKANYSYLRKAFTPIIEAAKRRFRSKNG